MKYVRPIEKLTKYWQRVSHLIRKNFGKITKITWVRTSYFVCKQRKRIQTCNSHQNCIMRRWFRSRIYVWQLLTKDWSSWKYLHRIDVEMKLMNVICNMKHDVDALCTFIETIHPKLVPDQCIVYDTIMQAITNKTDELYFIDAPGGTDKTFLISLNLATVRSRNKIALAIASSRF